MKLQAILEAVRATTGELKKTVTKLEGELTKKAKADLADLTETAKNEITEQLLALVSKLNK